MERGADLTPTIKMKLLNINAAAKLLIPNYKGPTISSEGKIFHVPLVHNKNKQLLVSSLVDTMKSLFATHLQINTDSKMGFVIGKFEQISRFKLFENLILSCIFF